MKKIKFRGYYKALNAVVYGDLTHTNSDEVRVDGYLVEPDSVAQFVGYDADDNEVYEDDELIDEDESPINSLYVGIVDSDSNAIDGEIGTRFSDVWIKKERGGNEKADF